MLNVGIKYYIQLNTEVPYLQQACFSMAKLFCAVQCMIPSDIISSYINYIRSNMCDILKNI